jgi:hypothetical protein
MGAGLGVSSSTVLHLVVCEPDGPATPIDVTIDRALLVGYTGRNRAAVLDHIRELEALGVAPPPHVPAIYPVASSLVTTAPRVSVGHRETSGEVEFFVVDSPIGPLVGVGSDHTDRLRETVDVTASKSLCGKVISHEVWRLAAVQDHWDRLELRAWSTAGDQRRAYQAGRVDALMAVPELIAEVERAGFLDAAERRMIFGGTLPTLDGFVYGRRFEVELRDPILNRALTCAYDVEVVGSEVRA